MQNNAIQFNSPQAFENLFRLHYSSLCAYANSFVDDVNISEDLVQDILLKIWQKKDEIPKNIPIRAYLFKATRNTCINHLKRLQIKKKHHETVLKESQSFSYEEIENKEDELHETIRRTIDKLPTERKKIFIMHRFEELKYKEIAERLNISIKTVENQIGKALSFLRDELKSVFPIIILWLIIKWIINE